MIGKKAVAHAVAFFLWALSLRTLFAVVNRIPWVATSPISGRIRVERLADKSVGETS
jgi:hypothetical protein